jgi:glycosyltransferase involved in cell wall biosynthesis
LTEDRTRTTPDISVIIPFRDGAADLPALVDGLRRQTLAPKAFEVIWIDDASNDAGGTWLRERLAPGWRILSHTESRGAYVSRNAGVRAAAADNLAFTDVDCRPSERWLEQGLAALAAAPRVAGRIHFDQPRSPSIAQLVDMGRFFRQRQYVKEGFGATANLFLRRSAFDAVGGFDERLRWGGDYEFGRRCLAAGIPIQYAEDVVVHHPARSSLRELLRKAERVGYGAGQVARRGGSPVRVFARRAWDRLSLTQRRGLEEQHIAVDGRWRSLLVSVVLLLVMAATALGSLRGFAFAVDSGSQDTHRRKGVA